MLQKKNTKSGGYAGTIIDFKTEKRLRERRNAPRRNRMAAVSLAARAILLPAAAGVILGRWLDSRLAASFSLSIALMIVAVAAGCIIAWRWRRS